MPLVASVKPLHQPNLLNLPVLPFFRYPATKVFPKIIIPEYCCWVRRKPITFFMGHLHNLRYVVINKHNTRQY